MHSDSERRSWRWSPHFQSWCWGPSFQSKIIYTIFQIVGNTGNILDFLFACLLSLWTNLWLSREPLSDSKLSDGQVLPDGGSVLVVWGELECLVVELNGLRHPHLIDTYRQILIGVGVVEQLISEFFPDVKVSHFTSVTMNQFKIK